MPTFDETNHPRDPQGKFATKPGAETDVALDTRPQRLSELGLKPGKTLTLGDYETGSRIFEEVDVTASEAGDFKVTGYVYVDLAAGLEPDDDQWLDERRHVIEASLQDRYGAGLEPHWEAGHEAQVLAFTSRVPSSAGTHEVLTELETCTRSVAAHDDLHGPNAPADYAGAPFFTNLRRDLDEHARTTNETTAAYELVLEHMETDGEAGTVRMAPESRELCRRDLSQFLVTNRHLITACRAAYPDYDEKALGRDLAYSRSGIGRAFDNGGLGGYGPELQKAADQLPMVGTMVDELDVLHVEYDNWTPGPSSIS